METKSYLGDGVYVDHNETELILTTSDGYETTNVIVLGMNEWEALEAYVKRIFNGTDKNIPF